MSSSQVRATEVRGGFAAVDEDPDPADLVAFLDAAQATAREYKERSYDLLRLAAGQRVVDVGCGAGDDLLRLAERVGADGRVVGVDASLTMLEVARRRVARATAPVELVHGSGNSLALPDCAFAAARADRVLHFLSEPETVMAELVRVVRDGGRVVVSEPDHDTNVLDTSEPALTARLLEYRRRHQQLPTPGRRLRRLFVDAALDDIEVVAVTGVVTSFAVADRLLWLTRSLRAAVEAGAISMADAVRWQTAVSRDDEDGRFFASMTVFTVGGTCPERG
jgi:ubiquinone/menaquinone biosynthesis C-methylase UbiE